jgi:sulfoxide reductase heme-binding subunit YedZ
MTDTRFFKLLIFINSLIPLALMSWDIYYKRVGPNPVEFATRTTGMLTLIFLCVTVAITPLRKIFKLNALIKVRRMVGLYAFFYGALHLLTYLWFDRVFSFMGTVQDVKQRPFILVGMTSFLLMVPLAITSTNKMIKRLGGKRWNLLHKLVYASAIAGALHFWMLVKSDIRLPLTFGFILLVLLGYRLLVKYLPETPVNTEMFPRK